LGRHDSSYRLLFSHARMICDLLRLILGEAWVGRLDLASAEKVPSSFTSRGRKKRESDVIWKFRRLDNDEPVYVYILLEFQSRPDRYMPVRLMTYMGLFLESLIAAGHLPESGKLPLVVPVVIYNGPGPWGVTLELADLIERLDPSAERYVPRLRYYLIHVAKVPLALLEASDSPVADLFRLETSAAWDEMIAGVSLVRQHVGPDEESLRHAFEALLEGVVLPRLGMDTDEIPARMSLEEVETMLAERIDEWNRKLAEENLQKGRQEGLSQGRREGLSKGRREGLSEGRREGEALTLIRLLEKKFGVLPKGVQKRIMGAERDLLLEWIDRVVTAERLEAVFRDA